MTRRQPRRCSIRRSNRCSTRRPTSTTSRSRDTNAGDAMSDHISGPRALAEPIADITDVYAFPSPERPGHLVLVQNTLPFAQPSSSFSDGLVYRFRVRPLTPAAHDGAAPFAPGDQEYRFDCVFSAPVTSNGSREAMQ